MNQSPPPNPGTETARRIPEPFPGYYNMTWEERYFGAMRLYHRATTALPPPPSTGEMELRKALEPFARVAAELKESPQAAGQLEEADFRRAERVYTALLASKPLPPTDDVVGRARTRLQSWLSETAQYQGDDPRAEHYRQNREALETALAALSAQSPPPTDADVEDTYEMGKREGRDEAMQEIDLATGGDGEYVASTFPERDCRDAEAMKARIVARFESRQSPPPIIGEGLEWLAEIIHAARHGDQEPVSLAGASPAEAAYCRRMATLATPSLPEGMVMVPRELREAIRIIDRAVSQYEAGEPPCGTVGIWMFLPQWQAVRDLLAIAPASVLSREEEK